ncbi:MAG: FG-GAP-like repeat-containing protein, partial [Pirellulaceae bacterium]
WKRDLGVIDAGASYDDTYDWGIGSSPIIFRNLVIVQADAQKDSYLAAFELSTGKPMWRVARDLISSFSTPTIFAHADRVELVCNGAEQMRGYDPLTGKELWRLEGSSKNTTPTPVVGHGMVFIASGYRTQPIFAVRPGAMGDLTTAADAPAHQAIAWNSDRGGPYMTTPLVHGPNLYILRRGILSCYEAKTGERIYQQRISGDRFYASPIAAGDKIFLASEAGRVSVVQAGRKYQLLATNDMGESCMATPAVSGDLMLIRTLHQLVAIRSTDKTPAPSASKSVRQFQKSTPLGKLVLRTAAIQVADLNGDGHLDIVVANGRHWPEQNACFLNDGKGGFGRRLPIGNGPDRSYAAPLADLDGDGDPDLVIGNDRDSSVVSLNDSRGHFQQSSTLLPLAQPTRNATLADLNGDQHIDILIANRSRQNFFYLNDGKAGFSKRGTFGTGTDSTIAVAAADMNGDGHVDLVVANRDQQPNRVYFNNGQAQFLKSTPFGTGADNTRSVVLADINGDKQLDIIAANIGTRNTIYLNDRQAPFTKSISFGRADGNTFCVTTGDLDRNGTADILVGNVQQANAVYFTFAKGKQLQEVPVGNNAHVTYGITVGDLDGDKFPEVITANSNGRNFIYWNRPTPSR